MLLCLVLSTWNSTWVVEAGLVVFLLCRMVRSDAQVKACPFIVHHAFLQQAFPHLTLSPSLPVVFLNLSFKIMVKHCLPLFQPSSRTPPSTQNGLDASSLGVSMITFNYFQQHRNTNLVYLCAHLCDAFLKIGHLVLLSWCFQAQYKVPSAFLLDK